MSKVYIAYTLLSFWDTSGADRITRAEEIEEIFDSEEKAIDYISESFQECLDEPELFDERGYTIIINSIPDRDIIRGLRDHHTYVVAKHISGAYLSIGFREYEVK